MSNGYSIVYSKCEKKAKSLNCDIDLECDLQDATTLKEVFKHFVEHSQNRSQGYAIKFLGLTNEDEINRAELVWNIIDRYAFDVENKYSYLGLFDLFKKNEDISNLFDLSGGKDIQFLELAKTCQCIFKYVFEHNTFKEFIDKHIFNTDLESNWSTINKVSNKIYNMGHALVCDFFKEQRYITGNDCLIKNDVHVLRFLRTLFNKQSDKDCYEELLNLFNKADEITKKTKPLYNLDKIVFKIGERLKAPRKEKEFARSLRKYI